MRRLRALVAVMALSTSARSQQIEPSVEIEAPFVKSARPRPKGEVAAAAHDEALARWNLGGTGDSSFASNRSGFHPGTRVRVDTRVLAGTLPKNAPRDPKTKKFRSVLSETSLLARSRKYGYWPFRLCFEQARRDDKASRGGASFVRVRIDGKGRVTATELVSSKLEDPSAAECIADRARELPLLQPPSPIEVELKVAIWPGDAPLPSLPRTSDEAQPKLIHSEEIRRTIVGARSDFSRCYAEGIARDPALWGRVQIHIELDARGNVVEARENESRFPDRDVSACVVRALRGLIFVTDASPSTVFEIGIRLGNPPAAAASSP